MDSPNTGSEALPAGQHFPFLQALIQETLCRSRDPGGLQTLVPDDIPLTTASYTAYQDVQSLMNTIGQEKVSLNARKALDALGRVGPDMSTQMLQYDIVSMSQARVTQTQHPIWNRWLERLNTRAMKQPRDHEQEGSFFSGLKVSVLLQKVKRSLYPTAFQVKAGQLKRDYKVSFSSAERRRHNQRKIHILAKNPSYPQHTRNGLKEAAELRKRQISRNGLEKEFPTFVIDLSFHQGCPWKFLQGLKIPLTHEETALFAEHCKAPPTIDERSQRLLAVKNILAGVQKRLKKEFDRLPASFHTTTVESFINHEIFDDIARAMTLHSQNLLQYQPLPAHCINQEYQVQIDEMNNALVQANTLNKLCRVLGCYIPRLIQVHPFSSNNHYIFAQLAREILLEYGYPTASFLNFNAMGMLGEKELAELLLLHAALHRLLEEKYQA